jgi:hypothetical protein
MKVKKETVVIGYIFYQLEGGYNKSFQQDKKQLAVFVPQHFSQQFFAHY